MKWLILAAASLTVVSSASLTLGDLEFQEWKLQFGKVYKTPQEEARRKDIWLSNRRSVLVHNIRFYQKLEKHHMDMNMFSDLDDDEFMNYTDFKPIPNSA